MGVIKDPNDLFKTGYFEDDLGLPENDNEEEEGMMGNIIIGFTKKHKSKSVQNKNNKFDENMLLSKSRTGVRRARRIENLKNILNMVDKDELENDTVMFYQPHVSAFAQLLMDHEKMKIWNDFVNGNVDRKKKEKRDKEIEEEEEWEEIPDKRVEHPAFTAEECFQRLDESFKELLGRRYIPLDLLEKLEDEVVAFFRDWPNSVFILKIACSFERLLLHHLCQYLRLHSISKTKGGVRRTHIENRYNKFSPPDTLLSKYIEKHFYS